MPVSADVRFMTRLARAPRAYQGQSATTTELFAMLIPALAVRLESMPDEDLAEHVVNARRTDAFHAAVAADPQGRDVHTLMDDPAWAAPITRAHVLAKVSAAVDQISLITATDRTPLLVAVDVRANHDDGGTGAVWSIDSLGVFDNPLSSWEIDEITARAHRAH